MNISEGIGDAGVTEAGNNGNVLKNGDGRVNRKEEE